MEKGKSMKMSIWISKEQSKLLDVKAKSFGFRSKSEYIRFVMLMPSGIFEKISALYERIIENGKDA